MEGKSQEEPGAEDGITGEVVVLALSNAKNDRDNEPNPNKEITCP